MKYGWRKQPIDKRDFLYTPVHVANSLPPRVDLRSLCPPVLDQGELGSCTANAIASAHQFAQMKQKEAAFAPSRLFIYYNERSMEGTVKQDAGAIIRDGFKAIANFGVCSETALQYNISEFKRKPPKPCYAEALNHKAVKYQAVTQTLEQMKACLADGFPFVFGIDVYESFESDQVAKTGIVPMPKAHEKALGGHAILCAGYDDSTQRFTIKNSWGTSWGDQGYCYLPYQYLTGKMSSDFWTVRVVQ